MNLSPKKQSTDRPVSKTLDASRATFRTAVLAIGLALFPGTVYASGFGDWRGVGAAMISFGAGILNALVFLAVMAIHRRYTVWSISKFFCATLLFVLSEAVVFALINLLWDRIYHGNYFYHVALSLNLLHPAIFLVALRAFRKETVNRTVWKINVATGAVFAAVVVIWVIGEVIL